MRGAAMRVIALLILMLVFPLVAAAQSPCPKKCATSEAGLAFIRNFEGYRPFVYLDAVGLPTVGYGHLMRKGEKITQPLMPEHANMLLREDVKVAEGGVKRRVVIGLDQNQYDALVSFTFNLGEGSLAKSTLLRKVNAEQHQEVPPQFMRWVNAGGRPLLGLITRRRAESILYGYE